MFVTDKLKPRLLKFVCNTLCFVYSVTSNHDSCEYAADLSFPLARDPDSVVGSTPICDSWLIPGWYRVKHSVMVKTPPMFGRCGTTYPIWANGMKFIA